eukprot:Opistho-2@12267
MATDRITQLQDKIDQMAHMLFNSVGLLQRFSLQTPLHDEHLLAPLSLPPSAEDTASPIATEYAALIAKTAREINSLIECLPAVDNRTDNHCESLEAIETANERMEAQFESAIAEGEARLEAIRATLRLVADNQSHVQRGIPAQQTSP